MDEDSSFQKCIVEYLESAHIGEFMMGLHCGIQQNVGNNIIQHEYVNPTESLSVPPPSNCRHGLKSGSCINCDDLKKWWVCFHNTVDDIVKYTYMQRRTKRIQKEIQQRSR